MFSFWDLMLAMFIGAGLGVLADRHAAQAWQKYRAAIAAGSSAEMAILKAVVVFFLGARS